MTERKWQFAKRWIATIVAVLLVIGVFPTEPVRALDDPSSDTTSSDDTGSDSGESSEEASSDGESSEEASSEGESSEEASSEGESSEEASSEGESSEEVSSEGESSEEASSEGESSEEASSDGESSEEASSEGESSEEASSEGESSEEESEPEEATTVMLQLNGLESFSDIEVGIVGEDDTNTLDESGYIELDIPEGADSFRIFIDGLTEDYEITETGWTLVGGRYVREFTRGECRNLITIDITEKVVEEEQEAPQAFSVTFKAEAVEIENPEDTEDVSLADISVTVTDSDSNAEVSTGKTEEDGTYAFEIPVEGENFTIALALTEGTELAEEFKTTYTRAELSELADSTITALIQAIAEEQTEEQFSISVQISVQENQDTYASQRLMSRMTPSFWEEGNTDLAKLTVELLNVDGSAILDSNNDPVSITGTPDASGNVTLTGDASLLDGNKNYRVYIGGYDSKYVVADQDNTRWTIAGSKSYKEFSGADIKAGNVSISIKLQKLADSELITYTINIYNQDSNQGINDVEVTIIPLDGTNPTGENTQKTKPGMFNTSFVAWQVYRQTYNFKVTSPTPDHVLVDSSQSWSKNGLELIKGEQNADDIWEYTFSIDLSTINKPAAAITLNYKVLDDTELIVEKDFSDEIAASDITKPIWIGAIAEDELSENGSNNITWMPLTGGTATFNLPRYKVTLSSDGTVTTSKPIKYYLFEYTPSSMKPGSKDNPAGNDGWVPYPFKYTPPQAGLTGYSIYYHQPIILNNETISYPLWNNPNEIEFDIDPSRDLKYNATPTAYKGTRYVWDTNKQGTLNPAPIEKGGKYTVDYVVTINQNGTTLLEKPTVYFTDIALNLAYSTVAAIGDNYVTGRFELYRSDNPSEMIDSYTIAPGDPEGLLTSVNGTTLDGEKYTKLLKSSQLVDKDFKEGCSYTIKFVGEYVYNHSGDHSETPMIQDVICDAFIDSTKIKVETQGENDPAKDAFIKDIVDTITIPTLATYDGDPSDIIVNINGTELTYGSDYKVAISGNFITISIENQVLAQFVLETTLTITYSIPLLDKSYEIPCSEGYNVINTIVAKGYDTDVETKDTETVKVTTIPDAFFTVSKWEKLPNTAATREDGIKIRLYDGTEWYSAKTIGNGSVIFMKDTTFPSVTWPHNSTIDEYNEIALLPATNAKYELRIYDADNPGMEYPPYMDEAGTDAWIKGAGYWYKEINTKARTEEPYKGSYCGPMNIDIFNIPDTGIVIPKTGIEHNSSKFYAVNGTKTYELTASPSTLGTVFTAKGLPNGTYTIYEVTSSTAKPKDATGQTWKLVTSVPNITISGTIYKLDQTVTLSSTDTIKLKNIAVENEGLDKLTIKKTVDGDTYSGKEETFKFNIYEADPNGDPTGNPLDFSKTADGYSRKGTITDLEIKVGSNNYQSITITGLPEGKYIVVEIEPTPANAYDLTNAGDKIVTIGWSGSTQEATFTNKVKSAGLTVTKTVGGHTTAEKFDFQLFEANGSTPVDITGKVATGDASKVTDAATGKFQLAHGEFINFTGLKPGVNYVVKELYTGTEYVVTNDQGIGNIATVPADSTVTFTNTVKGSIILSKTVTGMDSASEKFSFTISKNGTELTAAEIAALTLTGADWSTAGNTITVSFTADGTKSVTIGGLELDAVYTINEKDPAGYTVTVLPASKQATAKYTGSETVAYTNTRKADGIITVSKAAPSDAPANAEYKFELTDSSGTAISGKTSLTVKAGETKSWAGLVQGKTYRVYETDSHGLVPSGWTWDSSKKAYYKEIEVENDSTEEVKITANNNFTELKVTKTVVNGDENETFTFQVLANGTPQSFTETNGSYYYSATGVTDISIKHGETITIKGLPVYDANGAKITYTVFESDTKGYKSNNGDASLSVSFDSNLSQNAALTNSNEAFLTVLKILANSGEISKDFTMQLQESDGTIVKVKNVSGNIYTIVGGTDSTFTMKAGDANKVTIQGVVPGKTYKIVETDPTGYTATYSPDATIPAADNAEMPTITVTNIADFVDLNITKRVFENGVEQPNNPDKFKLVVTSTAADFTEFIAYFAAQANGTDTFAFGTAVSVPDVKPGYTYTVTEFDADGSAITNYTAEMVYTVGGGAETTLDSGKLGKDIIKSDNDGKEILVTVKNNRKMTGQLSVNKIVSSRSDANDKFTFTISPALPDGTSTFALSAGETRDFTGLPLGKTYTVTEALTGDKYEFVSATNGDGTDAGGMTATGEAKVSTNSPQTIKFENARTMNGKFEVKKTVIAATDKYNNDLFEFRVETPLYGDTWQNTDPAKPYYINGGTDITINADKSATFKLKHDQIATFENLPLGGRFIVKENVDTTQYSVAPSATQTTNTITATGETLTFTNTRLAGKVELTKSLSDNTDFAPQDSFTFALYTENNNVWTMVALSERTVSSADWTAVWDDVEVLPAGEIYRIYEENSGVYIPDGWALDTANGKYYTELDPVVAATTEQYEVTNNLTKLEVSKEVINGKTDGTFKFQILDANSTPVSFEEVNGQWVFATTGTTEFDITNGTTVTFYGLPYGEYTVFESDAQGHTVKYTYGENADEVIYINNDYISNTAMITNSVDTARITVTKEIKALANGETINDEFEFTLSDNNKSVDLTAATIKLTYSDGSAATGTADGKFTLKAGQTINIDGLPSNGTNTSYTIHETAKDGYKELADIIVSDFALEIIDDTMVWVATATATNEFDPGLLKVQKTTDGYLGADQSFTLRVSGLFQQDDGTYKTSEKDYVFVGANPAAGQYLVNEAADVTGTVVGKTYTVTELNQDSVKATYDVQTVLESALSVKQGGTAAILEVKNTRLVNDLVISKLVTGNSYNGIANADGKFEVLLSTQGGFLKFDQNGKFETITADKSTVIIENGKETTLTGLPVGITVTLEEQLTANSYKPSYSIDGQITDTFTVAKKETVNIHRAVVTNETTTKLVINKQVVSGNGAAADGTYTFNIFNGETKVPVRAENGVYVYDPSGQNYDIQLATSAAGAASTTNIGGGSIVVYGLDYAVQYKVAENTALLTDRYYLKSTENDIFTFTLDSKSDHTVSVVNARNSSGGSGGGGGGGGGGSSTPDTDRRTTTSIRDGNTPLSDINSPTVPLTNIPDEGVPLAGGIPIEVLGLLGVLAIGAGLLTKNRKNKKD